MGFESRTLRVASVGDVGGDHYCDLNLIRPGGCALNFAVHAREFFPERTEVAVFGAIGTDEGAQSVLKVVHNRNLISHLQIFSGPTSQIEIYLDSFGERSFGAYTPGVVLRYSLSAQDLCVLGESDLVASTLFPGLKKVFFAAAMAPRKKGGIFWGDFSSLEDFDKDPASVWEALPWVDFGVFGLNKSETNLIEGLRSRFRVAKKHLIITLGQDGVIADIAGNFYQVDAVQEVKGVDTTGAGDTFGAAFLSRWLMGASPDTALRWGCEVAAQTIQRVGAFPVDRPKGLCYP